MEYPKPKPGDVRIRVMANRNSEKHIPTNPFQLSLVSSTSTNSAFASATQNDAKTETTDQHLPTVCGGITSVSAVHVSQQPGSSTSTSASSNIFPSVPLPAQELLGNFSKPFGGPGIGKHETSRVFGNGTASHLPGTFGPKTETGPPFRVLDEEKIGPTVSRGISSPFLVSNPFSRVINNDSSNTSENIFGGTVSSFSSAPKLFGGTTGDTAEGLQLQKTEGEQGKTSILQVTLPSSVDAATFGTSHSSATSAPSLFGGVVSSSSAVSVTETQPITTSSSSIFGGKAVESSRMQMFGSAPAFSASVTFGNSSQPKSTIHESRTVSSAESVSSSNLFNVSSSGSFNIHQELCGTDESSATRTESSGKTHIKPKKKTLFDKLEDNKESVAVVDHKSYEAALEPIPASIIKPEIIPELFEKGDMQESSGSSPEYHKKDLTKIIIALIPDSCMDKEILKRHFGKFGEVKRIMLNSKVNQATVQYSNHHAASKAKKKGKKIHPILPEVKIFYGTPARRKSEESNSDAMLSKKKAIKTLQQSHQSSDLDPYTPLERPTNETLKSTKHFINRTKPHKAMHTSVDKISSSKKKQSHPAPPPPAKAVKSRDKTMNEFCDRDTYMTHERPADEISKSKKLFAGGAKPNKTVHLSVDDKSGSSKKKQTRPISPAREKKESTISFEGKDLKTILESQAHNNYDKYLILKARDKYLRNERTRTSDLKKAVYLAATCSDMCPEFERYMRDVQNDLSSYEMTNGVLDPRLAIKKFFRSSADKDVPLPHELRPGPVLLRTMDFLICNIINRGDDEDVELDVWYNYLWNRTRAIRNDLMQQQLIDAVAVVIMERCTRFHIYAAVRLCQEPPDLFDAKMNTEHLTKSLQTLKELYHDLGEKGEYFDTEAEFRAYEMLLNLNHGETIVTQYSQYREEVQKSSHVQFALRVVLALTTNNYVKFYKLIRGATYLQGCLLHRYFRQVRSKALNTLIRAYIPTKTTQTVPLQTIIKTLGFEDESDAVTFLRCHGISLVKQNVVLDRCAFIHHPEEIPPLIRPMKLVEAKLTCSVGEIIQGGPIPDNPLHTHVPHNSFDDQGYLKPMDKDASDQKGEKTNKNVDMLDSSHLVQQPERQQNDELLVHVKEIYKLIESSVLEEFITQVSTECVEMFKHELLEKSLLDISHELLEEGVQIEVRNVSCEGINEVEEEEQEMLRKQKEEEERERRYLEEMYHSVATAIYSNFIREFVDGFIRQVCEESVQEVEMHVILEELMKELPYLCINEVIMEQITKLSEEVIEEITVEQEVRIKDFQQKILFRKMGEYFQKWRMQVLKARRKKHSQEMFPANCSHLSIVQQNEAFGWGYPRNKNENRSALQLFELESNITKNLEKLNVKNQLEKKCAWYPLFFQYLIMKEEKALPSHNLISQYFKVLVCTTNSTSSTVLRWLRSKLGDKENNDTQEPLYNCSSFISKKSGLEYAWVLREVSVDSLSAEDVRGTSAFLFVTSCVDKHDPEYCKMQDLLMMMPMVSYCTIFYGCQPCDSSGWTVMEEDLLRLETSQKLQSLLLDFWKQQSKEIRLVSAHMNNFFFGYISKRFLEPALRMQNERVQDGKSPIPPSVQIDLYNKVIDHLIEVIEDKDLQRLEWPPPELSHMRQVPPPTWNSTDARHVVDILNDLKLPDLCLEGIMSWTNITNVLHAYVAKVSGPSDDGVGLVSHLNSLLSGTLKVLRPEHDYDSEDCSDWQVHVLQLPWTELVYACVSYKVSGLSSIPVFYQPKKLESFICPRSWWTACDTSESLWEEFVKENWPPGSRKRKPDKEDQLQVERTKVKKVPSKLLSDITSEKQRCMEFEKKLQAMLEINEELEIFLDVES